MIASMQQYRQSAASRTSETREMTGLTPSGFKRVGHDHPCCICVAGGCRLPNEGALIETLRARHPGLRWDRSPVAPSNDIDGPMFIRAGDHLMTILIITAPMPYDQQLWQRAARVWPDAFDAAQRHRAHLIISTMGTAENNSETKPLGFIESTRLTTALVGAAVEALPGCLAVAWCGNVSRSPKMWLEQSRRAFEPLPDHPYGLWMEIVPYRSGETAGAYTVGLAQFAGREIEFEVDGLDQRAVTVHVAHLASRLVASGLDAGPKSGAVFEPSAEIDHRVAVLYRNSRFNMGPVMALSSVEDRLGRQKIYEIIPASIARNHPLLVMLGKVGLFDPTRVQNQIRLRPDHYTSDVRMEAFDDGLSRALSGILATDGYAEADTKARRALASGDAVSAKPTVGRGS